MLEHDADEVIHRLTIKNRRGFESPGGFFYLGRIGGDDLHGIRSVLVLRILQQVASSKPGRLDSRLKSQGCADRYFKHSTANAESAAALSASAVWRQAK